MLWSSRRGVAACSVLLVLAGAPVPARAQATPGPVPQPDVPVTAVDVGVGPGNNSPAVVADPTEPRFLVAPYRLDAPQFGCALAISPNGGRGWLPAQPVPKLPPGADRCYAPEVAFDRSGRLYYLFIGLQGAGNVPMGAFLTTSTDNARTFTTPRRVLGPNVFGVRMALDRAQGKRGRVHLVWIQASITPPLGSMPPPPNPIYAAFSDNGGKTFSKPLQVSDPARERVIAPALALGPNHAVYVLYYDLEDDVRDYHGLEGPTWDGPWSLVLTRSTDGGRRFEGGRVVEGAVAPPERIMLIFTMPPASLAAGPDGRVYVAWHDARNGDWDVFLRRSSDGGRSWEAATRVNDDTVGSGRHQYLPRVAVAPNGRVDVVFYDRRSDPANIRTDAFLASSVNGGLTFGASVKLNSESFDSRIGAQYPAIASARGLVEFGARLGLLSTDAKAVAAWTDTRNAPLGPNEPTDVPPRLADQDIFATEVAFPPSRPSSK